MSDEDRAWGGADTPADVMRGRLRTALSGALRGRDTAAVSVLRSALAAIDNAEATDAAGAPRPEVGHATVAGTVAGVGAAELERHELSAGEVDRLVAAEITEREAPAGLYRRAGRAEAAERLEAQADVLRPFIDRSPGATKGHE